MGRSDWSIEKSWRRRVRKTAFLTRSWILHTRATAAITDTPIDYNARPFSCYKSSSWRSALVSVLSLLCTEASRFFCLLLAVIRPNVLNASIYNFADIHFFEGKSPGASLGPKKRVNGSVFGSLTPWSGQ